MYYSEMSKLFDEHLLILDKMGKEADKICEDPTNKNAFEEYSRLLESAKEIAYKIEETFKKREHKYNEER